MYKKSSSLDWVIKTVMYIIKVSVRSHHKTIQILALPIPASWDVAGDITATAAGGRTVNLKLQHYK